MPAVSVGSSYPGSSLATTADLPRVPSAGLRTGDLAYLATPDQYWRLDKASTAAVDANTVYADIALGTPANAGRWIYFATGSAKTRFSQANKNMVAIASTVAGQQCAPAITYTPIYNGSGAGAGSWVEVIMDGVVYGVGDGVTTDDFYFAAPTALGVARNIRDIVAGDVLVRGSGFLVPIDALDRFSYNYLTNQP